MLLWWSLAQRIDMVAKSSGGRRQIGDKEFYSLRRLHVNVVYSAISLLMAGSSFGFGRRYIVHHSGCIRLIRVAGGFIDQRKELGRLRLWWIMILATYGGSDDKVRVSEPNNNTCNRGTGFE